MDAKQAAAALDGNEYGNEGSTELFAQMKDAGLVAIFGASDDLMEFRGAIYDEVGCYDGGTAYLNESGLLTNSCYSDECPHFAKQQEMSRSIEAVWGDDGPSFTYKTSIPHETFKIMEDGEVYCIGIVFELKDAA